MWYQRDADGVGDERDDGVQLVYLANLLHGETCSPQEAIDLAAAEGRVVVTHERLAGEQLGPTSPRMFRGTNRRNGSCAGVVHRRSLCSGNGGRMIAAMSISPASTRLTSSIDRPGITRVRQRGRFLWNLASTSGSTERCIEAIAPAVIKAVGGPDFAGAEIVVQTDQILPSPSA